MYGHVCVLLSVLLLLSVKKGYLPQLFSITLSLSFVPGRLCGSTDAVEVDFQSRIA